MKVRIHHPLIRFFHSLGLVLYVQEQWRECRSPFPILCNCLGPMIDGFLFVWCFLGNAFFCVGFVILLEGTLGKKSDGERFESNSLMLYEVSIEDKECPLIWEVWDIHNKVQVFIFEDYMIRLWLLTLSLPWSSWILWASINICLVFCMASILPVC